MALEIEAADVVRVVLQFLKENGLHASYATLAQESQVVLNSVDNVENFRSDITHGRWEVVLPVIAQIKLPRDVTADVYEHIVLELAEMRDVETARSLLRQEGGPLSRVRSEEPERYGRLERLLAAPYFDAHDAYGAVGREKRRRRLADAISKEVFVVAPSRMMALIGQALKWQQNQGLLPPGTAFDLFRGTAPVRMEENEEPPRIELRSIRFGKAAHPESILFTPNGQMLITGSADGFVEVWDYMTGKLRKDLQYQANEAFMMHGDGAITCMAASRDSELLATGGKDGKIKVWRLQTGKCLRRFETAHSDGVSSLHFSRDGGQLLSSSFDSTARVHGLKSGKTLKEFRAHSGYVNDATYFGEANRIATASSDGTLRLWDTKTTDCVKVIEPPGKEKGETPVIRVIPSPKNPDNLLLCTRTRGAYIFNTQGALVRSFQVDDMNFVSCALSPRGDFLYCIAPNGKLYCFNTTDGELSRTLGCHEGFCPYGISHHPHRNLIATFASDGTLKIWVP